MRWFTGVLLVVSAWVLAAFYLFIGLNALGGAIVWLDQPLFVSGIISLVTGAAVWWVLLFLGAVAGIRRPRFIRGRSRR